MDSGSIDALRDPAAFVGQFDAQSRLMAQMIGRVNTSTLVRVVAVTNAGEVAPVGSVDVQPLANQVDAFGNKIDHQVLFSLPYFRVQGGANAVILDPQKGDIGVAIFADRDISAVKRTKAQANPASRRRHSMSDGMYFGGFLNAPPQQYVRYSDEGITVVSPMKVSIQAPVVEVDAQTANVNASIAAAVTAPAITLGSAGQSLMSFVTSAFKSLFNSHTHASNGAGVPNQQMDASHMTSTVKGG